MHFIATAQCPRAMPDIHPIPAPPETLIYDQETENPNWQTEHCRCHRIVRLAN